MKWRIIFLVFAMLMTSCFATQAGIDVPQTVKIGLKYGSTAVESFSLKNSNGFSIHTEDKKQIAQVDQTSLTVEKARSNGTETYLVVEKGGFLEYSEALMYAENLKNTVVYYEDGVFYAVREHLATAEEANKALQECKETNEDAYILDPNDKRIRIVDTKTGETVLIFSGQTGENLEISSKKEETLFLDTVEYRGSVVVIRQSSSDMTVISKVGMNEYLYSVTPSEIPANSGIEALKTQAVCARTYAVENISRHASMGFSLCNSQHCQVYKGVSWEHKSTNRAVDDTDKQVLTYNGKIITAVYSASCGGITEDVQYVWGSPYPYLKSVKDPYCKEVHWEVPLNLSDIKAKLASKGYDFGEIQSVEITEKTPAGRVLKLQVTGSKMTKVFERETARTILGFKSQFYDIVSQNTCRILTGSGYLYWNLSGRKIATATGVSDITGTSVRILTAENGQATVKNLPIFSDEFVIKGQGNGHGVGMCQNGAMGLAENGYTYEQILKHYYTGVEITTGN